MRIASAALACFLLVSCGGDSNAPDLIVHNAKIVTVNEGFDVAQAMAVRGDRIVAVGSNDDVLALAGSATEQLDLEGKTVLPGLIDTHVHAASASMYEFENEVPEMETIADVLDYVRSRAEQLEDGQWIVVSQVFITRLREQRYPTRAELDEAAPNNPVMFRTGPDASLNSLALQESGIDKDFVVPADAPGKIERDASGEPTGIIRSSGHFVHPERSGAEPTKQDRLDRLKMMLTAYNEIGLTSVADRDASDAEVELYRELHANDALTCRVFLNLHVDTGDPIEEIEARLDEAAADPLHTYDNMLWLRGVKTYMDGGMLTGSAYMLEPWGVSKIYSIEDPEYRGMRYIEPEKTYQIAKAALERDLQMTAHCQGDAAVTTLVDAYQRVNDEDFPVAEKRPNVTHSSFMTQEVIDRMKTLGVTADLQPAWLERDGSTLKGQFGDERLAYFHPYKSLFDAGVVIGGGSDHMQKIGEMRSINPYDPFWGMWVAMTRQPRWMDEPLHSEQSLSREQAIRFYTINNAYLTFEEDEKGSLENGKLADFIVIDRDILECPVDEIKDITVERTYLGGARVH